MAPARNRPLSVSNPDGSEPYDACKSARAWLIDHYREPYTTALRYHSESLAEMQIQVDFDRKLDEASLDHAKHCQECLAWISHLAGERIFNRQRRLREYCCPLLFAAVEEPKPRNLEIHLEYYSPAHYEGAYSWKLTVVGNEPKSLLISYCPFCGKEIRVASDHGT